MAVRVQVVLQASERDEFRSQAEQEGLSLSAWFRAAAAERVAAARHRRRITSAEELRAFFMECESLEEGEEPDWEQQRAVIERSKRSGITPT